jgi:RHS repeat-associated protein
MRFESSTSNSVALPYRYNGKELEAMNGLNEYDYGARRRETGIPVWTTADPLCEKKPWLSPYAYCSDNPLNRIDPDGKYDNDQNKKKKDNNNPLPPPIKPKPIVLQPDATAQAKPATLPLTPSKSAIIPAEVANKGFAEPAYKAGTKVKEFQAGKSDSYVRCYTQDETQLNGKWMMNSQDIKGLSPEQIQAKYSMPNTPDHMVDVNPPAGTTIRTGVAGPAFNQSGGGTQYQLMEEIPISSYDNPVEIPTMTPVLTPMVEPLIETPIEPEIIDPIVDPVIIP